MNQDARAFPNSKYLLLLLKTVGLSVQAPTLLGSTLSVALSQIQLAADIGLASGHAQLRPGHQNGDNRGQGPKLKLQDPLVWAQLSSISSMPCVTPDPPLLASHEMIGTKHLTQRAPYIIVLIVTPCLASTGFEIYLLCDILQITSLL